MSKPTFMIVDASLTGAKAAATPASSLQALIRAGQPADVGALSDPDTPLASLLGELTAGG